MSTAVGALAWIVVALFVAGVGGVGLALWLKPSRGDDIEIARAHARSSLDGFAHVRACTTCLWEAGSPEWSSQLDRFGREHEELHPGHRVVDPREEIAA